MSLLNILQPETQKNEWSNVYVNKINCDVIESSVSKPVLGSSWGVIARTVPNAVFPIPAYPSFGLFVNSDADAQLLPPEYYELDGKRITILKPGKYKVTASINGRSAAISAAIYMKLAINSGNDPLKVISSTPVTVANINFGLQVVETFQITSSGDHVSILLSNTTVPGAVILDNWRLEILKID